VFIHSWFITDFRNKLHHKHTNTLNEQTYWWDNCNLVFRNMDNCGIDFHVLLVESRLIWTNFCNLIKLISKIWRIDVLRVSVMRHAFWLLKLGQKIKLSTGKPHFTWYSITIKGNENGLNHSIKLSTSWWLVTPLTVAPLLWGWGWCTADCCTSPHTRTVWTERFCPPEHDECRRRIRSICAACRVWGCRSTAAYYPPLRNGCVYLRTSRDSGPWEHQLITHTEKSLHYNTWMTHTVYCMKPVHVM